MYPSDTNPYAGVFIKNQFEKMTEQYGEENTLNLFYMTYSPTSKVLSYLKYLLAYVRFIPQLFKKFDVVHVHYFGFLAPVALIYRFFHPYSKTFVTFHGSDINKDMPSEGLKNMLFRRIIKKFNGIIAVGESLLEPMWNKLEVRPHKILCAGVDQSVFYKESFTEKDIDLLVVGSFVPVKGLDVLEDALQNLKQPETKVCIVGHGPEAATVERVKELAEVNVVNSVNQKDLRVLYNRSKFLVFPSKGDAFGLVVTESIYSGTPAIVNADGGAQHQVVNGINGFVYEEHSGESLGSLIKNALEIGSDKYAQLSERCVNTNFQYSLESVTHHTMEMYQDAFFNYRTVYKTSLC